MRYKGSSRKHELEVMRRRVDIRTNGQRLGTFLRTPFGAVIGFGFIVTLAALTLRIPFSGEILLLVAWFFGRNFVLTDGRAFDFPYRVPLLANLVDGSSRNGKEIGQGITFLGTEGETREPIYAANGDIRTHMLVLGTTGSGKTEFMQGICANALVQNSGFIMCDGKGDPKLQMEIFRMCRQLGREDDLLVINFMSSGRDFFQKQGDKVTNNMNMMGNTSSGMLVELIVSLMDESGGGNDMWKGRAITFVASLTRPLVYLRDKGYIVLSPSKYLEYFELNVLEELVFNHRGRYGENFDAILEPLRNYLIGLPGYTRASLKNQGAKTLEQHGYIIMQLTRIFNDLQANYAHIFNTQAGDIDFFDVVLNRRVLVILLPAIERAPDTMAMLGKLCVGSVKQMLAGCLGNRIEGVIREIIKSRPTNDPVPFYLILDEYGYYSVKGFAVLAAQARSLGFGLCFGAQDFDSLKKASPEEAAAIWENTNIRAVGRLTSGTSRQSETWERLQGAAGETMEVVRSGFELLQGTFTNRYISQENVSIEKMPRLSYDDIAKQQDGEFTFIIGKKEDEGQGGGVRVIRGMGFYTAGPGPKNMRINDFLPILPPDETDLPQYKEATERFAEHLGKGDLDKLILQAIKPVEAIDNLAKMFAAAYRENKAPVVGRADLPFAVLNLFLNSHKGSQTPEIDKTIPKTSGTDPTHLPVSSDSRYTAGNSKPIPQAETIQNQASADKGTEESPANPLLVNIGERVLAGDPTLKPAYEAAEDLDEIDDLEFDPHDTNLMVSTQDQSAFKAKALAIVNRYSFRMDATAEDAEEETPVADLEKLTATEAMAQGGFETLEDKWQAEDRVKSLHQDIADSTRYIVPPEPQRVDIDDATQALQDLSQRCMQAMKQMQNRD